MGNIIKIMNFFKNLHFAFLAHIHTKDTNFIFGTPHTQCRYTQTKGHTQTHMDTDIVPLSHFALFVTCMYAKDTNFIFGMPQIYTCTDTQTHAHTSAETPAHTDTDSCTQIYISTHADIHRHTCIFFYIHKHTYIYVRSILPAYFIFSCHLPNELRSPLTYFCSPKAVEVTMVILLQKTSIFSSPFTYCNIFICFEIHVTSKSVLLYKFQLFRSIACKKNQELLNCFWIFFGKVEMHFLAIWCHWLLMEFEIE